MKQISLLCLLGVLVFSGRALAQNTPMAINLNGLYNYDAVGTANEVTYATGKGQTLAAAIGGHNLANSGRAFTNTDSLSSGTALPRYGVIANTYTDAFVYDTKSGSNYVSTPNVIRLIATGASGMTVAATTTITPNPALNYNDLNMLFVQSRSSGAGTYQTTITVTYTTNDSKGLASPSIQDTGAVAAGAGAAGGTFGSAGINSQGGLPNATDSDTTVTNEFSSPYGVATQGAVSVISSTAGSNLWQLTTPLKLDSTRVVKTITITVSASGAGNWNELAIFGLAATPTFCPPPPPVANDPVQTLNGTFDPGRLAAHPRLMFTPATLPALKAFYNNTAQSGIWRAQFDGYIGSSTTPVNTNFLTDGTEAQRQTFWRLPTAALAWVLTGNQSAFNNAVGTLQLFLALPDWETSIERNTGLSAANNMVGVALAYDWLYNDLDPTFREQVRQKLLLQARCMYYNGYQLGNSNVAAVYWQLDYWNNHRWARGDGFALAAMASYSGASSENYIMNQAIAEMTKENSLLPADGSHHESESYLVFGANHLTMSMESIDDCMGTNLLGGSFWQNVGAFRMQSQLSSFNNGLDYGDFGGAPDEGAYNNFLLKLAAKNSDANLRAATIAMFNAQPTALTFNWFSLLWDNPNLTGGSYQSYPLSGYYGNMGISFYRDSWTPGGIAAMFKCAPLGGVTLNTYRDSQGDPYMNVAHDDPDANSFIFFSGDDYVAASDQYSQRKQSEQQNTILVNSKGQNPVGRAEPQVFDQPGSGSMSGMATAFAPVTMSNGVQVSEGEAAGSYPAIASPAPTRPAISRFRRLFMWNPNKYILVLDDLRSATSVTFTSLVQGPGVTTVNSALGQFSLTGTTTHTCPFQVVGSLPLTFTTITSTADNMSASLNYKQLQAAATGTSLQLAAAYNAWNLSSLNVAIQNQTPTTEDIAVTGPGITDTYRWTYATGATTPSTIGLLVAPAFTSNPPTSPATVNVPYSFTLTASGYPASTFTVTGGALPPGLKLMNGIITGTPNTVGIYVGTITANNGVGAPATQNFSITVNPAGITFQSWEAGYFSAQQIQTNDPTVVGPNANPAHDGTVNLLKFVFDISPTANMGLADRAALPKVGIDTTSTPGTTYLTLTYRQKPNVTGITVNLQTSTDLTGAWSTVTPDISKTVGTDGATGDPIVEVGVKLASPTAPNAEYVRLNVTMP